MKNLKRFKEFKILEISGTELIGPMGPNYGPTTLPRVAPSTGTDVIYSDIADKIFTYDDYQTLYQRYLSLGGKPLDGFTKDNLEEVVTRTTNKKSIMESDNFDIFSSEKNHIDKKKDISKISKEYLTEKISIDEIQKRESIEDITRECLRDFCFINGLEYHIQFGRYYLHTKSFLQDSLINLIKLLDLDPDLPSEKCFEISMNRSYDSIMIGYHQIEIDENTEDFKNCITHLKKSLERELDIVDFNICNDDHIYLIKYEVLYENELDEDE